MRKNLDISLVLVSLVSFTFAAPSRALAQKLPSDIEDPGLAAPAPVPTPVSEPAPEPASATESRPTPSVDHVPVASTPADEPLLLKAHVVSADLLAELVVRYRRAGTLEWRTVRFQRASNAEWSAEIPAADLTEGVVEYYVASHAVADAPGATERLHCASPALPHALIVVGDEEARWRRELEAFHLGNRARIQIFSEYVSLGSRAGVDSKGAAVNLPDNYWRAEGDLTYRLLGWIYSIRLGGGVLRGQTYFTPSDGSTQNQKIAVTPSPGLDYAFAELRFRLGLMCRLDLRVILGGSQAGFDGGVGGQLLIGTDPGTHFAIGGEAITTVGKRGYLRLAWATVPGLPMSFTLEATTLISDGDTAGRLYYSIGHRFGSHVSFDLQVGYATRDFRPGGPSVGVGGAFEF